MAVQTKGSNGHYTGKVGNTIGYVVDGRQLMSGLHDPSSKPPTADQVNHRLKFGMITGFLADMADMVDVGFQKHSAFTSAMNAAVSYNVKNAVTGVGPNYEIDFSKVLLASGKTNEPEGLVVVAEAARKLKFTWEDYGDFRNTRGSDKLMLLVYCPVTDKYFIVPPLVLRSALTYTLTLPAHFTDQVVHCYLMFISEKGVSSNSVYKGPITVV